MKPYVGLILVRFCGGNLWRDKVNVNDLDNHELTSNYGHYYQLEAVSLQLVEIMEKTAFHSQFLAQFF